MLGHLKKKKKQTSHYRGYSKVALSSSDCKLQFIRATTYRSINKALNENIRSHLG